MVVVAVLYIGE